MGGLTSLDVSDCENLESLDCLGHSITSIKFGDSMPSLLRLDCSKNRLASLELPGLPNLDYLWCSDNLLTSLDLSKVPDISFLFVSGNRLSFLDLSVLPSLKNLECANNQLTTIDVSQSHSLWLCECWGNPLDQETVDTLNAWAQEGGKNLILEKPEWA